MKLLILGAGGQLGSSLLASDLNPFEVHAPSRESLDVTDFGKIKEFILNLKPDVVINATAWTNVPAAESSQEGAFLLNEKAVGNLAIASKLAGSSLIHISTDYVFDGMKLAPYTESDIPAPLNAYGASKLAGELAILSSGLEKYYIIRTSWLYSKFGRNFVKTIASKALKGEPASIIDDQFGSPTFAGDLAKGIVSLINSSAESGIYNYSNEGITSWYQFGQQIYRLLGFDESLVTPRKTGPDELKRPKFSPFDLSKWSNSGLSEIRAWQVALSSELQDIVVEIKRMEI